MTIQCACSSSLVAVCLACTSLMTHECDAAIAGGASITLPQLGYLHQPDGVLSDHGVCRPFDADADGTVFGNGAGYFLLRRLSDAVQDGDPIRAVIRGWAVNNDGGAKVGYTAPSASAQAGVITDALQLAGVSAETLGYLEAHGTGTVLGDEIEVAGVMEALAARRSPLPIGSVKANVGHLSAAAGAAGLMKTVLALQNNQIPASINVRKPTPHLADTPLFVNTQPATWPRSTPRRAGVSSFGMGGANAHVVLEESPHASSRPRLTPRPRLFVVSAKTEDSATVLGDQIAEAAAQLDPADVARTLQSARRHYAFRRYSVHHEERLDEWRSECASGPPPAVLFYAPGFLFTSPETTRRRLKQLDWLKTELDAWRRAPRELQTALDSFLSANANSTCLLGVCGAHWLLTYAMAKWFLRLGISPTSAIGSDVGILAALAASEQLTFEESTAACHDMAQSIESTFTGVFYEIRREVATRAAADLNAAVFTDTFADTVWLAGLDDASASTTASLKEQGLLVSQRLFRSSSQPMLNARLNGAPSGEGRFSVSLGSAIDWASPDLTAWLESCGVVGKATRAAGAQATSSVVPLVLGDTRVDADLLDVALTNQSHVVPSVIAVPAAGDSGAGLLAATGRLWSMGVEIDWKALQERQAQRVSLPTYVFQRRRYWLTPANRDDTQPDGRRPDHEWLYAPSWRKTRLQSPARFSQSIAVFGLNEATVATFGAKLEEQTGSTVKLGALASTHGAFDDEQSQATLEYALANSSETRVVFFLASPRSEREVPCYDEFLALMSLARRLATDNQCKTRLVLVTCGAFSVLDDEPIDPWNALLAGVTTVLSQEAEHVLCRHVDARDHSSANDVTVIRVALTEHDHKTLAVRGNSLWRLCYEPSVAPSPLERDFKAGGRYLITGGLGGVGLAIAQHLTRHYDAQLILWSRRSLDDRLQDPRTKNECGVLFQDAGRVTHQCVDVTNVGQVQKAAAELREAGKRLDGVIHAAASYDWSVIQWHDPAQTLGSIQAKVEGAANLVETFRADAPDWILLCSSLTATLGGVGQAAYCAANCYLNALAYQQAANGVRAVQWDTWRDTGLANPANSDFHQASTAALGESLAESAMSHDEAISVLKQCLNVPEPMLAVSTTDLSRRLAVSHEGAGKRLATSVFGGVAGAKHPRPMLATPYVAPAGELEQRVAKAWEEHLGVEQVGVNDNFFELGGHSLVALQLITRLREELGVKLTLTSFTTAEPTVAGVAQLVEQLQQTVANADDTLETLLTEIETLPQESVESLLAGLENEDGEEGRGR